MNKTDMHTAAVATMLGSFVGYLPSVAALFTVIWMLMQIGEQLYKWGVHTRILENVCAAEEWVLARPWFLISVSIMGLILVSCIAHG